jgi:undecaprenyl phosphate N,N'-diacetylbacillosamine 1-phosphate transferase
MTREYAFYKRIIDVGLAWCTLVLLSPLFGAIIFAIWLDSGRPIFYIQERIGQFGRPFPFFKFRTMVVGAERVGTGYEISAADSRITRLGHFLRRWHLDELPQLYNVLRGEMSIVGPRPTLAYQVEQYTPRQRQRLEVPPGLTGLAQVKGLNSLTWPERIEWDLVYVEQATLWLDLEIMLRTFGTLAHGENVYGHGWESSQTSRAAAPPENPPDAR